MEYLCAGLASGMSGDRFSKSHRRCGIDDCYRIVFMGIRMRSAIVLRASKTSSIQRCRSCLIAWIFVIAGVTVGVFTATIDFKSRWKKRAVWAGRQLDGQQAFEKDALTLTERIFDLPIHMARCRLQSGGLVDSTGERTALPRSRDDTSRENELQCCRKSPNSIGRQC